MPPRCWRRQGRSRGRVVAAPGHFLAVAATGLLGLAACAGRPAVLPPPIEAAQVTATAAAPRPAEAAPRPAPANPRLPPNPELVALPGGRPIPPPPAGAAPGATPPGETLAPARGLVPRPAALPPTPAEADGCFIPPRAVTTQLDVAPPPVARDRTRAALASMTTSGPEGDLHVAGVYRASLRLGIALRIGLAPNGCLVPDVTVRATAPRGIFVAAEFNPGSCRYDVILAHEREHARIDDTLLADLDGWLAAPLRQVLAAPGALRGTAPELAARLQARFEQAKTAFIEARRQAQLSIDTPAEYARASRACPG